ncbi:multi-sensor hybrid histidine kinase [Calothrix sp. NIES-4071]|nr:multi-sensor hybrid histidine kinase [Calothrix sp. NIES-4071]BAZ56496.1 multi-sensor hybrid histidine kinase [Calothrix sp. NIES-4105]
MQQEEASFNLHTNMQQTQKGDSIKEDGMLLHLVDGSLGGCNGIECFGYSPNEMIGKNLFDLFDQITDARGAPYTHNTYPAIIAFQTCNSYQKVIIGFRRPNDDNKVWLEFNFQPLFFLGATKPYAVVSNFYILEKTQAKNNFVPDSDSNTSSELIISKTYSQLEKDNTQLSKVHSELQVALEELNVAKEEMQHQNLLLENERQRYVDLFNFAPDGYIVTDTNGKIQEANQSVALLLGSKQENIVGKYLTTFIPHEEYQNFYLQFNQSRALPQLQIQTKELQIQPEKGVPFCAEVTVASIHHNKTGFAGLRWLIRDITSRKHSQQALQQSELYFRTLADAMPQLFWTTLPDGYHDYFNKRWFEYTGMTLEQTQGWGWSHLLHPDDRQRCLDIWNESLRTGKDYNIEYRFKRALDGQYRWFLGKAFALRDKDGKIIRWFGSCTDIDDTKRVEQALRESEERYRILTEVAPQVVWMSQNDGKITYCNQYWLDYTGLSFEQTIGYQWVGAIHPEDRNKVSTIWYQATGNGDNYEAEIRCRRGSDGMYRWFAARGLPLRDDSGQIVKWIGVANDIHDRKQSEIERERLLLSEQAAREQAENANRIKDEFLAVLSHELRTPLNPIIGWVKLLKSGKLKPQKVSEALDTIERNAKLQVDLIEDLLDVSRILRGKLTLNPTRVNLISVISAAIDTVRLAAEAKSIQILSQISTGNSTEVLITGDVARLQQIFWNLLSNAIKFTPSGGQVEIRLLLEVPFVKITVSDNGIGISPDFLPHIFDYFRQEDSTTTRKFGGLGLGLAIVRNLVELHGGTVKAYSSGLDQGATFTVKLPLLNSAESKVLSAENNPISTQHSALSTSTDAINRVSTLSGIRVLAVDDDQDSRDFIAFALELYGAEVTSVASALEALQVLANSKPHILVSDIGMPLMDGYELLRQVRKWAPENGGLVPAIALTAFAGEYDRQKVLDTGFHVHLAKPVEPDTLAHAIESLVQK